MTLFALISTISYMTVSMAKPVRFLSKERPFDSQFNGYLVVSVLLQFTVHIVILYLTRELVFSTGYTTPPFDYKITFSPSLMNTAMYIITNAQETTTFFSNYRGHPFMTSFFDNKPLLYSVIVGYAVLLILTFEVNPELNKLFELVSFPSEAFKYTLAAYIVIDAVACYVIEKVVLFIFTIPKKKEAEHLVSKETLEAIEDYKEHNDDVLDETCHKFNFIEMFKENFNLQKNMLVKKLMNDNEKKLKELSKKGKLTSKEKKMIQALKEQQKRFK
jgi:cation-transporting ATPase 13A1